MKLYKITKQLKVLLCYTQMMRKTNSIIIASQMNKNARAHCENYFMELKELIEFDLKKKWDQVKQGKTKKLSKTNVGSFTAPPQSSFPLMSFHLTYYFHPSNGSYVFMPITALPVLQQVMVNTNWLNDEQIDVYGMVIDIEKAFVSQSSSAAALAPLTVNPVPETLGCSNMCHLGLTRNQYNKEDHTILTTDKKSQPLPKSSNETSKASLNFYQLEDLKGRCALTRNVHKKAKAHSRWKTNSSLRNYSRSGNCPLDFIRPGATKFLMVIENNPGCSEVRRDLSESQEESSVRREEGSQGWAIGMTGEGAGTDRKGKEGWEGCHVKYRRAAEEG
ncbi:hypothetical protein Cgig2_017975 [Carnegiea gigantea]|uniref:Uncharacterized protein n=1 Tax=Carnegiea gigantea TaxID=171969 RepID=A0A9Q1JS38_9CARY|nr:hypothetical protein Cgig2_017975 [Carnegiea gigantea]